MMASMPASTPPAWARCALHAQQLAEPPACGRCSACVSRMRRVSSALKRCCASGNAREPVPSYAVLMHSIGKHAHMTPGTWQARPLLCLWQEALSFCEDCEDVVSMAMSAVRALMLKHGVDPQRIGR